MGAGGADPGTLSVMATMEKLTVSVQKQIAVHARLAAKRRGESLSTLTDRALRAYLVSEAVHNSPVTDEAWLDAAEQAMIERAGEQHGA